jgi:formylglycine-generating enzyme
MPLREACRCYVSGTCVVALSSLVGPACNLTTERHGPMGDEATAGSFAGRDGTAGENAARSGADGAGGAHAGQAEKDSGGSHQGGVPGDAVGAQAIGGEAGIGSVPPAGGVGTGSPLTPGSSGQRGWAGAGDAGGVQAGEGGQPERVAGQGDGGGSGGAGRAHPNTGGHDDGRSGRGGSAGAEGGTGAAAGPGSEGGNGGAGGTGEAGAPPCVPGQPCGGECGQGETVCDAGEARCVLAPRTAGASCAGNTGTCTGDGSCVAALQSCPTPADADCGLVTVQAGIFDMGPDPDPSLPTSPGPVRVQVSSFVMDAFEVTVARFRVFWEAGHPAMTGPVHYPQGADLAPISAPKEPTSNQEGSSYNWTPQPGTREHHPINRVTWSTALAFCVWDGGRLPTEAEWEYAAQGRAVGSLLPGRTYPWGEEEPTCERTNYAECDGYSQPVGSTLGAGGLFDLSGNVKEYTADLYAAYGSSCWPVQSGAALVDPLCLEPAVSGYRIARGGDFTTAHQYALGARARPLVEAESVSSTRGIRCVRDMIH